MTLLECFLLAVMGSGGIAKSEITQPWVLTADVIVQPDGGVTLSGFPESTVRGEKGPGKKPRRHRHRRHRHPQPDALTIKQK